jgi:hypothetical protein
VARSVSRITLTGAVVLAAAGPLAGCSTTQQAAARLQLNDARIRASQVATTVVAGATDRLVAVTQLATISRGGRTAYVVLVRNQGKAVSDLPISVGYTVGRRSVYANRGTSLPYFAAHLPALAGGKSITWVFTTTTRPPAGARLFARVGAKPATAAPGGQPPALSAQVAARSGDRLAVKVSNDSDIPQYQVPLFAFVRRGRGIVAAGTHTIAELAAGATTTISLPLVGPAGASPVVEALPTIFN